MDDENLRAVSPFSYHGATRGDDVSQVDSLTPEAGAIVLEAIDASWLHTGQVDAQRTTGHTGATNNPAACFAGPAVAMLASPA